MAGKTKSTSQQQSTSSNAIDPEQLGMANANYAGAQQRASTLTPYTGQLTAGFNPTQIQAQGLLTGTATDPTYAANNNSAIGSIQGVLGSNPNTTVTPQTLAGTDLSPYMNPYTKNVIDTTNNSIGIARQTANTQDNQKASAAGAFGGSRSGVANALTNQYYDQDTAASDAALNQANYAQAVTGATTDINNNMNAQQSSIANALAEQGVKLNAAGQLVNANGQALQTAATQGGILSSVGDAQQAQSQTELTNAYNAYIAGQQLTVAQQNMLNSALGIIPTQQTITSSGSGSGSETKSPGLTDILTSVGNLASGISKL